MARTPAEIMVLKRKRVSIKASCMRIKGYVDSVTQLAPDLLKELEIRNEKLLGQLLGGL